MIRNFITLKDFDGRQLAAMLQQAIADKKAFRAGKLKATLPRKVLAMIFEKPSLRTRVSFETAMTQLGGHAIYLTQADIGLGKRETIDDVARVLGRMCDGIVARTYKHLSVERLAEFSPVPVINALSEYSHPCQAMADLMTATEHFGSLSGKKLVFVGDGNNVARSLYLACGKLGMTFVLTCPPGYELPELRPAGAAGKAPVQSGALFSQSLGAAADPPADAGTVCHDPRQAARGADILYTDTWVSMGQEEERAKRLADFASFQVNGDLLAAAPGHAIVMHCLPAYRGLEITEEVFEAHAATILEQAENRLHFQRTLLDILIGRGGIQ